MQLFKFPRLFYMVFSAVFAVTLAACGDGGITQPVENGPSLSPRKVWACTYTELNGSTAESCSFTPDDCGTIPIASWCQETPSLGDGGGSGSGAGGGTTGGGTTGMTWNDFLNSLTPAERAVVEGMNELERAKCAENWAKCYTWAKESAKAIVFAQYYGGSNADYVNALRHAMWQALLTYGLGVVEAQAWAQAHELGGPPDPGDTCRDLITDQVDK